MSNLPIHNLVYDCPSLQQSSAKKIKQSNNIYMWVKNMMEDTEPSYSCPTQHNDQKQTTDFISGQKILCDSVSYFNTCTEKLTILKNYKIILFWFNINHMYTCVVLQSSNKSRQLWFLMDRFKKRQVLLQCTDKYKAMTGIPFNQFSCKHFFQPSTNQRVPIDSAEFSCVRRPGRRNQHEHWMTR